MEVLIIVLCPSSLAHWLVGFWSGDSHCLFFFFCFWFFGLFLLFVFFCFFFVSVFLACFFFFFFLFFFIFLVISSHCLLLPVITIGISFFRGLFSGAMLVSGRVNLSEL